MAKDNDSTNIELKKQLDNIAGKFEENWTADGKVNFIDYLKLTEQKHGNQLLRMLIEVDIKLRKKNGLPVSSADYSELGEDAESHAKELVDVDVEVTVPPSKSDRSNVESTATYPTSKTDEANHQIGPYKLLQQIGEGGMGSVWMAEQEKPVRRRVALKLIRGDMGSKETIARFEAERQALAMMDHQNIAKVLDAGTTDDGNPFFVMELVKGVPITKYCDENKLSIDERLELFIPVCNAVQHAHQKGIIHRDLKPSNVLVTLYDGKPVPKVIDFGLAKALEHTTKLTDKTMFTEFGKVVGTIQYMAPEQAEMNALDVDTRTDVYSLGVMLYELLTGSTPLDKETLGKNALLQILAIIREKEPPRPSHRLSSSGDSVTGISEQRKINPSKLQQILRGELDWIVMKALEKDRTRRYETANGFATDIERYLGDEPIVARPPSTGYRLSKFIRRNRTNLTIGAAIAISMVIATVVSVWFAFESQKAKSAAIKQKIVADRKTDEAILQKTIANSERKKTQIALEKADNSRANAVKTLASANFQLAVSRWDAGRVAEARALLDEVHEEHRHLEWNIAASQINGSRYKLFGHISKPLDLAFRDDGNRLVSLSDKHILKWDLKEGSLSNCINTPFAERGYIANSFDLSRIAVVKNHVSQAAISRGLVPEIEIWDVNTGELLRTFKNPKAQIIDFELSSCGTFLAISDYDGVFKVWNCNDGKLISSFSPKPQPLNRPDPNNFILCVSRKGELVIAPSPLGCKYFDPSSETLLDLGIGNNPRYCEFDFTERRFAVLTGDGILHVFDKQKVKKVHQIELEAGMVHVGFRFSPDGRQVLSFRDNDPVKLWNLDDGELLASYKGHSGRITAVAFSPDGSRIATASDHNTIMLWHTRTDSRSRTVYGRLHGYTHPVVYSNSGKRFLTIQDSQFEFRDSSDGSLINSFEGTTHSFTTVLLSEDGTRMVSSNSFEKVVFETATGKELMAIKRNSIPHVVSLSPSGKILAFGSGYGRISFVNIETKEKIREIEYESNPLLIRFTSEAELIAVFEDQITRINTKTFAQNSTPVEINAPYAGGHHEKAVLGPNNRLLLVSEEFRLQILDVTSGQLVSVIQLADNLLDTFSFSKDGTRLVAHRDDLLKIWDIQTGREILAFDIGLSRGNTRPSFHPTAKEVALTGVHNIRFIETEFSTGFKALRKHEAKVNAVTFSQDDLLIASGGDDHAIHIWNADDCVEWKSFDFGGAVDHLAFSSNNKLLAALGRQSKQLKVFSLTGKKTMSFELPRARGEVRNICFDNDNKTILALHLSGKITTCDIETVELIETLSGEVAGPKLVSSNRESRLAIRGNEVLICDNSFKDSEKEAIFRRCFFAIDSRWHARNARLAEFDDDWIAVAMHAAWALHEDDQLHFEAERLKLAYKMCADKLDIYAGRVDSPFPKNWKMYLSQYIDIRPPKLSAAEAREFIGIVWQKVKPKPSDSTTHPVSDLILRETRFLADQNENKPEYQRTLAALEYRMGNWQAAIELIDGYSKKWPNIAPKPTDLAILAMAHHQIGDAKLAKDYQSKIHAAIKKTSDSQNSAWNSEAFAKEAEALLSIQ